MPDVTVLSNHLKKQGFHVVFSNTAKDTGDVEVGFCNIRKDPAETPGRLLHVLSLLASTESINFASFQFFVEFEIVLLVLSSVSSSHPS